jgi:hypothetical protein
MPMLTLPNYKPLSLTLRPTSLSHSKQVTVVGVVGIGGVRTSGVMLLLLFNSKVLLLLKN